MSNNKSDPIIKYLSIAGGLALAYVTVNYLAERKPSSKSNTLINLDRTRKILQEIKYQMYANCISFAEGVKTKLKAKFPEQELDKYLRTQMSKLYEQKEELIIIKYGITKQELAAALQAHKNDKDIIKNQKEIFDMMDRAIQGEIPDLTVPQNALKLLNLDQTRQVYREVCELIAVKVWQKLEEKKNNDPSFNCKDDADYKKAIRELSIYDLKINFLEEKGFRKEWGCPNEVFFKVIEVKKMQNPEFKVHVTAIEKAYEKIIEVISHSPETMNKQRIIASMEEAVNGGVIGKPVVPVPQKQAPPVPKVAQPLFSSASSKKPVPKPKQNNDDDFDMEKLMMEELLKRSQQVPIEVKPEPVAISAPVTVVEKEQIKHEAPVNEVEVEIEIKQEEPKIEASAQISALDSVQKALEAVQAQIAEDPIIFAPAEEISQQIPSIIDSIIEHAVEVVQVQAPQQPIIVVAAENDEIKPQIPVAQPQVEIQPEVQAEIEIHDNVGQEQIQDIAASQEPEVLQNSESVEKKESEQIIVRPPSESFEQVIAPNNENQQN